MASRNPTGTAVIATEWLLVSLAAVMIGARLYMRLGIKRQPFRASDAFLCLAWIASVTTASFDIIFIRMGILRENVSITLVGYTGTPEDKLTYDKLSWVRHLFFYTTFYLCKFAILSFYLDLFPIFLRKTRIMVWVTMGYCVCALAVTLAINIFLCWPIERNWVLDPTQKCYTHLPAVIFQIAFALHLAGELMIFTLPFFMLRHVRMKLDIKIGVYATFAVGIIAIAFAFTRFFSVQLGGETIPGQSRKYHSLTLVQLYSALDINVGLIVACLPSLRPYLRMFSQSAIVSCLTSMISKEKSGGSKNSSEQERADADRGFGRQQKKTGWTDVCEETVYESRSGSLRGEHDSDIELVQGSVHVGVAR